MANLVGIVEARNRQVLSCGLEILADGHDVAADRAEVAHDFAGLVHGSPIPRINPDLVRMPNCFALSSNSIDR